MLKQGSLTSLTLLGVGVWVAAVLLLVCNHFAYRVLEGYVGPFARSSWRRAMQLRFVDEQAELQVRYRALQAAGDTATGDGARDYYQRRWRFYARFPYRRDLVLPTRFGNVIRAFETYTLKV